MLALQSTGSRVKSRLRTKLLRSGLAQGAVRGPYPREVLGMQIMFAAVPVRLRP
jgi:hypothetical protein